MIDLNGNPLISYTINASLKSNVDETWVNSEDVEILSFSKKCGAKTFLRPQELATDESSSESVLLHFAQNIEFDILVFIQATSPLLKPRYINKGIELMKDYDYKMASIVWRWNHPDNPKAQIHTKGFPNEKLMSDLDIFHMLIDRHKATVAEEDERIETQQLKNAEYRKQIQIRNSVLREKKEHEFVES